MPDSSVKTNYSTSGYHCQLLLLTNPSCCEKTMLAMCRVFKVAFEEGLAQYTPKRNGAPPGRKSETTREVRSRGK
jgi:hypothetical protein